LNSAFVAGVDFTMSGRNCRDQGNKQGQSFPGGRAAVLSGVARMSPGKGQERDRERDLFIRARSNQQERMPILMVVARWCGQMAP